MKNTLGTNVRLTLFGESHGPCVGAVLDGLCPGIAVREEEIARQMRRRQGLAALSTARREADRVVIDSGVFRGKTTGTPLCLRIANENTKSADYEKTQTLVRPSHADLCAQYKYHGFADPRGGGHFSGRLTAALCAAGGILLPALRQKGIFIYSHVLCCAGVYDRPFSAADSSAIQKDGEVLAEEPFAVSDAVAKEKMMQAVAAAKSEGDSVGGIIETAVLGVPAGLGEPWFDTVEGMLSNALFSVPAVKGVEFGAGFSFADLRGSVANDPYRMKNGAIVTQTNRSGGVQGGITNGMPILFRTAVKPTPSIYREQKTVDFKTRTEQTLKIEGRHDPAIVARAAAVLDAVTALVLCDLCSGRFGTDFLREA